MSLTWPPTGLCSAARSCRFMATRPVPERQPRPPRSVRCRWRELKLHYSGNPCRRRGLRRLPCGIGLIGLDGRPRPGVRVASGAVVAPAVHSQRRGRPGRGRRRPAGRQCSNRRDNSPGSESMRPSVDGERRSAAMPAPARPASRARKIKNRRGPPIRSVQDGGFFMHGRGAAATGTGTTTEGGISPKAILACSLLLPV